MAKKAGRSQGISPSPRCLGCIPSVIPTPAGQAPCGSSFHSESTTYPWAQLHPCPPPSLQPKSPILCPPYTLPFYNCPLSLGFFSASRESILILSSLTLIPFSAVLFFFFTASNANVCCIIPLHFLCLCSLYFRFSLFASRQHF